MSSVNLDELERAAMIVEDGGGTAAGMVSHETGIIHLLNEECINTDLLIFN